MIAAEASIATPKSLTAAAALALAAAAAAPAPAIATGTIEILTPWGAVV